MRAWWMALVLMAAPAMAQTPEEEAHIAATWSERGPALDAAGITKPMFRQFNYWASGQYILGMCAPYLAEESVLFWRTWWKGTPLENSDVGRSLMLAAVDTYDAGARDRLTEPMPRGQCIASAKNWGDEMKRVVSDDAAGSKAP